MIKGSYLITIFFYFIFIINNFFVYNIMTLYSLINQLRNISLRLPNVNTAMYGDVFELNSKPNNVYSVFFITETDHIIRENTTEYQLTLYYIDRLFEDKSNVLDIHSTGIQVLAKIINILNYENDNIDIDFNINATTFEQKFSDYCAGVYVNLNVIVNNEISLC